LNNEKEATKVT